MKILLITTRYKESSKGGVGIYCKNIADGLTAKGHEITVLVIGQSIQKPFIKNDGAIRVLYCPQARLANSKDLWAYGDQCSALYKKFINIPVDIIQANDWFTYPTAKAIARHYTRPIISFAHIYTLQYWASGGSLQHIYDILHAQENQNDTKVKNLNCYFQVEKSMLQESDRIVVASDYMKIIGEHFFGVQQEKFHKIPIGIDAPKNLFANKSEKQRFRSNFAFTDENIIVFAGRFNGQKGLNHLIDSIPHVIKEFENVRFLILGGGVKGNSIEDYLDRMKGHYRWLTFTGFIPNEDVFKIFHVSDIGVMPSIYEPFGITCLEMMRMGLPVVASDTGGLSEIFEDNVSGLKLKVQKDAEGNKHIDELEIAEKIKYLLANSPARKEIADQGRKLAETNFDLPVLVDKTLALYQTL